MHVLPPSLGFLETFSGETTEHGQSRVGGLNLWVREGHEGILGHMMLCGHYAGVLEAGYTVAHIIL
jgi:hypothetical protein